MRKFMGLQDDLVVVAAGAALAEAGLLGAGRGDRIGLYLAVGYIPFEERDIAPLAAASRGPEGLSMEGFWTRGITAMNPVLTFRCLPNMPAFHVSLSFDLRGPYVVTYPGAGQVYLALEQAAMALEAGLVDHALVGGVAHQRNFLVEHHMARLDPPVPAERLADAAGFVVLERAGERPEAERGRLLGWEMTYRPGAAIPPRERFSGEDLPLELGAASLPFTLAERRGRVEHDLAGRDGLIAASRWEMA
jgi:3-oxoacyl-(acyl-carrier-protein) synthase